MLRFVEGIKKNYGKRILAREKQWPPVKRDKLINLQLVETDKGCGFSGDKSKRTPVHYGDLFKVEVGKKLNKVLVEGHAGIGKTTLSLMLSEEWALGNILQQFSCVLLLPLREKKVSSATSLLDLLKLLHSSEKIRTSVAEQLEENQGEGVLIIADGWDELEETQRSEDSFLYDLLFGDILSFASVLLTSRPSTSASLHDLTSVNLVEIVGFNEESIKDYIVFEFENDSEKASGLLHQLESNPFLRNVCSIPLNCAITCHLWRFSAQALPSTLTELYTQIILNVILRDIKKKFSEYKNLISLVSFDSIPSALQSGWQHVCEFAFNALSKDKLVFSQEEISAFFPEAVDLDQELPCFGLLQSSLSLLPVGHCRSFNFLHLTFQEYLAAFHLVRLPTEKQLQVVETTMYSSRFNMVLRFFIGLARGNIEIERVMVGYLERVVRLVFCAPWLFPQSLSFQNMCHYAFESMSLSVSSYVAGVIKEKFAANDGYTLVANTPHDYMAVIHVLSYINSCLSLNISLLCCNLRDAEIERLVHLLSSAEGKLQVTDLNLRRNNITSKGFINLFSIAPLAFSALQTLDLNGNKIDGDGVSQVVGLFAKTKTMMNTLRCLDLSHNPLGVSGVQSLESAVLAEVMPNIVLLRLADVLTVDMDINGALLATFIEALSSHWHYLTHLDLSCNKLGNPGAQALGEVLSRLTSGRKEFSLNLSESMLGDEGITALSDSIVHTCTIKQLNIEDTDIHEKGILSLMNSLTSGALVVETLCLDGNPLGYSGLLAILRALCTDNVQLKALSVDRCTAQFTSSGSQDDPVNSTDLDQLLDLHQNTSIEYIFAQHNNFSGYGVNVLAAFIHFCCSLNVYCSGCQLTSKDMKCLLVQLSRLKSLQSTSNSDKLENQWYLDSNNIDDEGVAALIEHLPSLQYVRLVSLNQNPVSDGMKERLEESLDNNRKALVDARRCQAIAEWSRTSLPPQGEDLFMEFNEMWNQLLACILEKCFALKHASHQPSNILEMKDDEQLSFHEEGSVTFQSVFNRSDQRTTHEENHESLTSSVTDPTPATDSHPPSTRPDITTTVNTHNLEPLEVESKPPPKKQKLQPVPEDVSDIDIDNVDNTTRLDDDDYTDISDELRGLESKYYKLGHSLHLTSGTVDKIQHDNPHDCGTALVHVIDEWLKMNYSYSKFGPPSWQLLVKAVETVDHEQAKQIAGKHPKVNSMPESN